ncbi:IucA/IucC family protein [Actinoplanes auranticolor]|uniref:Iron transporter n=1 Tax=Actinoplanes auranticolor TaxID=47988 RepID=A0A919VIS9_9ACTN|nr:IucA/IucC family protein [Actinoplanes auranticolor]GIM63381.1 iron transporter [Actinoplanes auranticolor]
MPTPPTTPAPPDGHTADPARTRADLHKHRPDLVTAYDAALPAARAAILSRLLNALHHEPIPGVTHRAHHVELSDGRTLTAPAAATLPFATPQPGLTAHLTDSDRSRDEAHDDPAALLRALDLGPHTERLAREIDNSVANLALAYADPPPTRAAQERRNAEGDPDGLGRLEQRVLDGHPLHPCTRTRGGMTVADVLAYAPEHRPVIRLRRLAVPPARWYGDTPPVLYAHPWQAGRLIDRYPWLTDAGQTEPVRPLMSLRTVAPLSGADHVKTAVDIQMTSAVRTVSPAAVRNGPRLSALLETLTADLPLTVLRETAAGAVLIDGRPQRHLAYLRRQAPRITATETVLPLGALPLLLPRLATDPYAWWHDLVHRLLPPLLTVLDRGVALEAHGQNTLLVLDGDRPARIVYRDLGGVRVSARRLRAHGVEAPPIEGDLPSDDPDVLRTKLTAAVLGTVTAQLVAVLARAGADPARLWASAAAAIRGTATDDAARLLSDPLPVKATTAMRLADDPLDDLWTTHDNPMAGA